MLKMMKMRKMERKLLLTKRRKNSNRKRNKREMIRSQLRIQISNQKQIHHPHNQSSKLLHNKHQLSKNKR